MYGRANADIPVETCIKDRDPQIKACGRLYPFEVNVNLSDIVLTLSVEGNDYECLCNQYTALEACYNNCPNDPCKWGFL